MSVSKKAHPSGNLELGTGALGYRAALLHALLRRHREDLVDRFRAVTLATLDMIYLARVREFALKIQSDRASTENVPRRFQTGISSRARPDIP